MKNRKLKMDDLDICGITAGITIALFGAGYLYSVCRERDTESKLEREQSTSIVVSSQPSAPTNQIARPQEAHFPHVTKFDNYNIWFQGDPTPTLRAYAFAGGNIRQLSDIVTSDEAREFSLPADLRNYDNFTVFAINGDGILSQPTYFSVIDDKITEKANNNGGNSK